MHPAWKTLSDVCNLTQIPCINSLWVQHVSTLNRRINTMGTKINTTAKLATGNLTTWSAFDFFFSVSSCGNKTHADKPKAYFA